MLGAAITAVGEHSFMPGEPRPRRRRQATTLTWVGYRVLVSMTSRFHHEFSVHHRVETVR